MTAQRSGINLPLAFVILAGVSALLSLYSVAHAQSISMTLDDILIRLDGNLKYYNAHIPNLICDEHAVSKMNLVPQTGPGSKKKAPPGLQPQTTVTESTFRLKRVAVSDKVSTLEETREVKTVDGQPSQGSEINGPAGLTGAFSGAGAIASVSQAACLQYTLQPMQPDKPTAPYIIDFVTAPKAQRPDNCVLKDDGSGRIYVDSDSMQITRIEFTAPHHPLTTQVEMSYGRPVRPPTGAWTISIDYTNVTLGRSVFWLPSAVKGTLTGGTVPTVWSFDAQYSNFEKLEVDSQVAAPAPTVPQP